jgi:hypothetical protein
VVRAMMPAGSPGAILVAECVARTCTTHGARCKCIRVRRQAYRQTKRARVERVGTQPPNAALHRRERQDPLRALRPPKAAAWDAERNRHKTQTARNSALIGQFQAELTRMKTKLREMEGERDAFKSERDTFKGERDFLKEVEVRRGARRDALQIKAKEAQQQLDEKGSIDRLVYIVDEIGVNWGARILNSVLKNVSAAVRPPDKHRAPVIQRRKRRPSHFLARAQALRTRTRTPASACCAAWRDAAASSWAWER